MNLRDQLITTTQAHDPFTVRATNGADHWYEWDCRPCGIDGIPVTTWEEGDEAVHSHLAEALAYTVAAWLRAEALQVQALRDAGEPVGQEVVEAKLKELADAITPAVTDA